MQSAPSPLDGSIPFLPSPPLPLPLLFISADLPEGYFGHGNGWCQVVDDVVVMAAEEHDTVDAEAASTNESTPAAGAEQDVSHGTESDTLPSASSIPEYEDDPDDLGGWIDNKSINVKVGDISPSIYMLHRLTCRDCSRETAPQFWIQHLWNRANWAK